MQANKKLMLLLLMMMTMMMMMMMTMTLMLMIMMTFEFITNLTTKQQRCTCITSFVDFFAVNARRKNAEVQVLWRTQISGHEFFFLFLNVIAVPMRSPPRKFAYIGHFQRIGINVTRFEKTRIHFKSDVFTVVTVVDATAPYLQRYSGGCTATFTRLIYTPIDFYY